MTSEPGSAAVSGQDSVADNAKASWDGTLTEFLAALDPGPAHDWGA